MANKDIYKTASERYTYLTLIHLLQIEEGQAILYAKCSTYDPAKENLQHRTYSRWM